MRGISHQITIYDGQPTEEQLAIYAVLIRSLRDLPYEHIIFEFADCDEITDENELAFFQVCVHHDDLMRVEFRTGPENNGKLFKKECSADEAIELLRTINASRKAPDREGWENITDTI